MGVRELHQSTGKVVTTDICVNVNLLAVQNSVETVASLSCYRLRPARDTHLLYLYHARIVSCKTTERKRGYFISSLNLRQPRNKKLLIKFRLRFSDFENRLVSEQVFHGIHVHKNRCFNQPLNG